MIAYDNESFISVTSTKKLENDWNELNFYSKNKQKVADMSKGKLLSIIKPIKMKKVVIILIGVTALMSFSNYNTLSKENKIVKVTGNRFSLINDTKEKVSIYTGTGFVSLNKGSKTSIGCNLGKEVRWANSGRKGDVIFKIISSMCGKTLKLSDLID